MGIEGERPWYMEEKDRISQEQVAQKKDHRDVYREEFKKKFGEDQLKELDNQMKSLELSLLFIKERSSNNPELSNSIDNFMRKLDSTAWFGKLDEEFNSDKIERLNEFFNKAAQELSDIR